MQAAYSRRTARDVDPVVADGAGKTSLFQVCLVTFPFGTSVCSIESGPSFVLLGQGGRNRKQERETDESFHRRENLPV